MPYIAVVLDDMSSAFLLASVPPLYHNVYAHHVTLVFNPSHEEIIKWKEMLDTEVEFDVVGYAQNVDVQAVALEQADGLFDGIDYPHVTISTSYGVGPKMSKMLLAQRGKNLVALSFTLSGTIKYITN